MASPGIEPHHRIAERIARLSRQRGGFRHSILIHGPLGAGHRDIAIRFGQSVFCETGEGDFGRCGICRNCKRVASGVHPDWIWVAPDRSGKGLPVISIDTVRELQNRLVLEPFEGRKVVGCLYEAEKMKAETANSLLKLVEEPPSHALFILVTENRQRILPTIRSRCLPVPLGPPSSETLVARFQAEFGMSAAESREAARLSAVEGQAPDQVLAETAQRFREEWSGLLFAAIDEGETAFMGALKSLASDRESMTRVPTFWRELLHDSLVISQGREDLATYQSFSKSLTQMGKRIEPLRLARLMDQTFECEEAIQGYANPHHTLAAFLSRVSEASSAKAQR